MGVVINITPKLSLDNVSLSGIDKVIVYPMRYFPMNFASMVFTFSKMFMFCNRSHMKKHYSLEGYVMIVENSNKTLSVIADGYDEKKVLETNNLQNRKSNKSNVEIKHKNISENNFLINFSCVVNVYKIVLRHEMNTDHKKEIINLKKKLSA